MTVLTVQVEANQDDGERSWDSMQYEWSFSNTGTSVYIGSEDMEGGNPQDVACYFRFLDVDIPSTATINSAKLQFMLGASYSYSSKSCRIYAEDIASSAAITSDSEMTDAQGDRTTAYATWDLDDVTDGNTSSFQDSEDFTSVIDEIINVGGWDAGDNNITILLMDPTDADMMDSWVMNIRTHDAASGANAVKLVIDYTAAAAGATATPAAFLLFLD